MPRSSERRRIIETLEALIVWENLAESSDEEELDDDDEITGDNPEELLELIYSQRYLEPRVLVPKSREWAERVLPNHDDRRFRRTLRMSRSSFHFVLENIQSHRVFLKKKGSQLPVEIQLQISLYRFGRFGNGASVADVAERFGVSEGVVIKSTRRVVKAIISLEDVYLSWFTASEAANMKKRILVESGFRNCLGFLDGTTIVLADKPVDNGEVYYSRKCVYGLNCQIVSDLDRRIRFFFLGYPASVHDSRCIKESRFCTKPEEYFNPGEYVLADSAYTLSEYILTSFKKPASLNPENADFNQILSSMRVCVEHCIGILKNRFESLKGMRHRIRDKKSAKEVVEWAKACAILHNMILEDSVEFEVESDDDESSSSSEGEEREIEDDDNEPSSTSEREERGDLNRREIIKREVLLYNSKE